MLKQLFRLLILFTLIMTFSGCSIDDTLNEPTLSTKDMEGNPVTPEIITTNELTFSTGVSYVDFDLKSEIDYDKREINFYCKEPFVDITLRSTVEGTYLGYGYPNMSGALGYDLGNFNGSRPESKVVISKIDTFNKVITAEVHQAGFWGMVPGRPGISGTGKFVNVPYTVRGKFKPALKVDGYITSRINSGSPRKVDLREPVLLRGMGVSSITGEDVRFYFRIMESTAKGDYDISDISNVTFTYLGESDSETGKVTITDIKHSNETVCYTGKYDVKYRPDGSVKALSGDFKIYYYK